MHCTFGNGGRHSRSGSGSGDMRARVARVRILTVPRQQLCGKCAALGVARLGNILGQSRTSRIFTRMVLVRVSREVCGNGPPRNTFRTVVFRAVTCLLRATGPRTCMLALPWGSHIKWRPLQKPLQLAIASDLVALQLAKGLLRDLWLLLFVGLDVRIHTTKPQ